MQDVTRKQTKFVGFLSEMIRLYPEWCYASTDLLNKYKRDKETQAYLAFLEVLIENDKTAELLLTKIGLWNDLQSKVRNRSIVRQLQNTITGEEFGGSHRRKSFKGKFGQALFAYAKQSKRYGGPLSLLTKDYEETRNRLRHIPTFGDLAKFDYLERLCLIGLVNPPLRYFKTGGGPRGGIEMIFGSSNGLVKKGNSLLQLLKTKTDDDRAIFALETFLCQMQKRKVRRLFSRYLSCRLNVQELIDGYIRKFCSPTQISPLCPR